MADLKPTAAVAGLPITLGRARISALETGRVSSVAPFAGRDINAALAGIGLTFPTAGTFSSAGAVRLVWAGRDLAFLMGVEPPAELSDISAVTDQTDGWVWLRLSGADARAVLARLTPLDLRDSGFPVGTCARSVINHMQAILMRPTPEDYDLAVFRSMAGTLVHDLTEAMRAVAARSAL